MGALHRRTLSLSTRPLTTVRGRLSLTFTFLLLLSVLILFGPETPTITKIKTHISGGYPYVKPSHPQIWVPTPDAAPNPTTTTNLPSKLIIKAQIPGEDLNWLLTLRATGWRNQIITMDAAFAHLHAGAQRVDKGRIADAYLRWLITNYDALADTIVFVPPGLQRQEADKAAWRVPNREPARSIQKLNVQHVADEGFAPLVCPSKKVCAGFVMPASESPAQYAAVQDAVGMAWGHMFNDSTRVPERIAGIGGSAFVVSRGQVRKRSVEEYARYWEWLANTELDDDSAGEVVERLWHVIFGREAAWCPGEDECRCDVFGEC